MIETEFRLDGARETSLKHLLRKCWSPSVYSQKPKAIKGLNNRGLRMWGGKCYSVALSWPWQYEPCFKATIVQSKVLNT